jgi:hypothetical protein
MNKERPPSISQETLAEALDEINDKLDNVTDKLDYLIDHLPPHSHQYDFPVNDD